MKKNFILSYFFILLFHTLVLCLPTYNNINTNFINSTDTIIRPRPFPIGLRACLEDDFRQLEILYDSTKGEGWVNDTNWLTHPDMSLWFGITLTADSCDVKSIELYENNLKGGLPNLNLPNLTNLYLPRNEITGSIPNFNLPNLQSLHLFNNQLTGDIPNFNLPNLNALYLFYNQLRGSIPNFNLPNLSYLSLSSNQLTGTIPNFNLPNLNFLLLEKNQLTGDIPNFNLPNLSYLLLDENQLTGSIPNLNLPNLGYLIIENNQLTGIIPNFSNIPKLYYLYLSKNQLTGAIPNFSLDSLNHLYAHNNQLSGSIPNFNLPNLNHLYLFNNQLTGNIPNFSFPKLNYMSISNNQLTGNIPNFNFPKLNNLYLYNNKLTGTVPNFNFPDLAYLYLNNNQLSGVVPDFTTIDTSARIYLHNNKFIFGDLLGKPWLEKAAYAPQAKIPITYNNGFLTVQTGLETNNQQFEWYQDNVLIATNQSNTYHPTQLGTFYCKVKSPVLTVATDTSRNLILQSEDYFVAVLSVELLNFTATPLSKTTQLTWQTASEKNARHFDLERSYDGKSFNKIGQIAAFGNSSTLKSYNYVDENPLNGINYYRLRQIDFDGTATFSNIVSVEFNSKQKLHVFPNPAQDMLTILSESGGNYGIIDVFGREILRGGVLTQQTNIDISTLVSGVYFVKTSTELVKFSKF